MVIDFEKIAEAHLEGFKGGQGKLDTRNYVDDKVKIMYSIGHHHLLQDSSERREGCGSCGFFLHQ